MTHETNTEIDRQAGEREIGTGRRGGERNRQAARGRGERRTDRQRRTRRDRRFRHSGTDGQAQSDRQSGR